LYLLFRGRGLDVFPVAVAVNMFSHPLLVYVIPGLDMGYLVALLVSELFIVLGEGVLLSEAFSVDRFIGLKASLFANLVSWQFAPFLVHVLGVVL